MSAPRLSSSTLSAANAQQPAYDRAELRPAIVHLGLGAFARAHLAVYVDDLIAAGHTDRAIIGVSLRHSDVRDALMPQDGLYTLGTVDATGARPRVIGSVRQVLHAPSERTVVRAALASAEMVTVTVTEKGYCARPADGRLDVDHPDVVHDIAAPSSPRSVLGHLILSFDDRRRTASPGVNVLSLDNIPSNGVVLRNLVLELATLRDPSLAEWISGHVTFPCSMVDRMVPTTDERFRAAIRSQIGVDDAWPVRAEPFTQWVLESTPGLPMRLNEVGVQLVDDVAPWEALKLRVLNGLHTTAALFGLRHGLTTVDEVTADPAGRSLLDRVAAEIVPVVVPPSGVDTCAYARTTLQRFANPALGHRCEQIATDSSQKLPQRLLTTLRDRRARSLDSPAIMEVIALWGWSTLGVDHRGAPRTVADPLAARYAEIVATSQDSASRARALIGIEPIFGDLTGDPQLTAALS